MKTLEQIGNEIGFKTNAKNYRKAFHDKYIRNFKFVNVIHKYDDLIDIFKLQYYINWSFLSRDIKLSEEFIRKFSSKVNWIMISESQKLSESFIREFKDVVNWFLIGRFQKLSEPFIIEFINKLDIAEVCRSQKLSESFINEYNKKLDLNHISVYQYFDKEFIHNYDDLSEYEIIDGYVYGYKTVRSDRYSLYNFQYQYLDGTIHESFSDQTHKENSFGLSVGTKEFALNHAHYTSVPGFKLLYVRTKISDITRIVHNGHKLRCRKIEIIKEIKY